MSRHLSIRIGRTKALVVALVLLFVATFLATAIGLEFAL